MKLRFRYIFSSLILLSLLALGENVFISSPNVKYYKETERLHSSNSEERASKCFHYSQYEEPTAAELEIIRWSVEYIVLFNQRVHVQLNAQVSLYREISPFNLLCHKSYIPRKSIEHYSIS